jgi:hypothetical protein
MSQGQEGKRREPGRCPGRARRLAWIVALLAAVGCQTPNSNQSTEPLTPADPLLGGPPLITTPSSPQAARGAPVSGTGANSTGPRPIPTNTSATSPAEIAAGGPPEPSSTLRIPTGNTTPGSSPSSPGPNAPAASGPWRGNQPSSGGAILKPPETVGAPLPAAPPPTGTTGFAPVPGGAPVQLTSSAGVGSLDQAYALLDKHKMTWSNLQYLGDQKEWKFSCAIPNPQNPNVQTRYSFQAPGKDGLAAVREVLQQIEQDAKQ